MCGGPGFPKCGACELLFASGKGGLWTENFQIWGRGKFSNLGACELKISKFWGLRAKIWVKIEAVEAKISKFSQKGVWDPCELPERRKKGVFRAAHPRTPFLGQCPPGSTLHPPQVQIRLATQLILCQKKKPHLGGTSPYSQCMEELPGRAAIFFSV